MVVRLPLHSPQRQSPRRQAGARAPVPPDPVNPPQPTVQPAQPEASPPDGGPIAAAPSTDAPSGSGGPVESVSRPQRGKGLYKKNNVTGNSGPLLAIISARYDDYRNACGGQRVTATKERRRQATHRLLRDIASFSPAFMPCVVRIATLQDPTLNLLSLPILVSCIIGGALTDEASKALGTHFIVSITPKARHMLGTELSGTEARVVNLFKAVQALFDKTFASIQAVSGGTLATVRQKWFKLQKMLDTDSNESYDNWCRQIQAVMLSTAREKAGEFTSDDNSRAQSESMRVAAEIQVRRRLMGKEMSGGEEELFEDESLSDVNKTLARFDKDTPGKLRRKHRSRNTGVSTASDSEDDSVGNELSGMSDDHRHHDDADRNNFLDLCNTDVDKDAADNEHPVHAEHGTQHQRKKKQPLQEGTSLVYQPSDRALLERKKNHNDARRQVLKKRATGGGSGAAKKKKAGNNNQTSSPMDGWLY